MGDRKANGGEAISYSLVWRCEVLDGCFASMWRDAPVEKVGVGDVAIDGYTRW